MNRVRSALFGAILVISSSMLALGGEVQFPGRSDTLPPPPVSASATDSTKGAVANPTPAGDIQIVLHDFASTVLSQVLLTLY